MVLPNGELQIIFHCSLFKLYVCCQDCDIKPVDFKPSLNLQKLTCTPYEWDGTLYETAMVLTIALMDAIKGIKIDLGFISVRINDTVLPFICEHERLQYRMPVYNSQPAYIRKKRAGECGAGDDLNTDSSLHKSVRKNGSTLPPVQATHICLEPAALTAEDTQLADIREGIESMHRLMGYFYLPQINMYSN